MLLGYGETAPFPWDGQYFAVSLYSQSGYIEMTASDPDHPDLYYYRPAEIGFELAAQRSYDLSSTAIYLIGGDFADRLVGGAFADRMIANAGNDYLIGNGGDDRLDGRGGNDTLFGNDGNDTLIGGTGEDRIIGGAGVDQLYGNEKGPFITPGTNSGNGVSNTTGFYYNDRQADTFVFNAGDSGAGSANRDVIRGFQPGLDKIDLTSMGADTSYTFAKNGDGALLRIDADHNGTYEMQVAVIFTDSVSYTDPYTWTDLSSADIILA